MHKLITDLIGAIYAEPQRPARIELGPDDFRRFQIAHREALAAVLAEADNVYPGSLVGVPVVEAQAPGAVLVRAGGARVALELLQR